MQLLAPPFHRRSARTPSLAVAAVVAVVGACTQGGALPKARIPEVNLRRDGTSAARSDALAAEWLIASGAVPAHSSLLQLPTPLSAPLAARLAHHVADHLWCQVLARGDGPSLAGCARIRRLALDPNAPADGNVNGTNLDETLSAELAELAALCGAASPDQVSSTLAPRRSASAELRMAGTVPSKSSPSSLRTLGDGTPRIDARALGRGLLLRALAGAAMGSARHGAQIGATANDGLLALVAIEQALAIEETILTDLSFDGEVFRSIGEPREYDPATGALWLPSQLAWAPHPHLASTAADWMAEDRASDLADLALLMRGGAELGWLTDPSNPSPQLRELFVDTPLAPPGGGAPPRRVKTWVDDVRPIMHGTAGCLACHSPPVLNNNFSVASYEDVFMTGLSGVPGVHPGDHAASPLWLVLDGFWTPPGWSFPLSRMPFGGPYLPQAQIDTVAEWIDDGAVREQPPVRPGPRPGIDLARVVFRNAVALHEVPRGYAAGLLDRRSGIARSGLVDARAQGEMLSAIAALIAVDDFEPDLRDALRRWAQATHDLLTSADGAVVAELDLRTSQPTAGIADLATRAAVARGLLAAGRIGGDAAWIARGRAVAGQLIDDSWQAPAALFDDRPRDASRVLSADDAAAVLGMLAELQVAGDLRAQNIAERFTQRLSTVFPCSEFDGDGEVLGDGIPDTDRNGVNEVTSEGLAPLLADLVVEGPPRHGDEQAPITWSRHVLPLVRARCIGCHLDGLAEGGYRIDTPELAARPGDSGLATMIVPGSPDLSFLIEKLNTRTPGVGAQMPLDLPPLAPHEIGVMRRWIEQGARDR